MALRNGGSAGSLSEVIRGHWCIMGALQLHLLLYLVKGRRDGLEFDRLPVNIGLQQCGGDMEVAAIAGKAPHKMAFRFGSGKYPLHMAAGKGVSCRNFTRTQRAETDRSINDLKTGR